MSDAEYDLNPFPGSLFKFGSAPFFADHAIVMKSAKERHVIIRRCQSAQSMDLEMI